MGSDDSVIIFGSRLKGARTAIGLTQNEVAKKAGISTNHYARLERGEIKPKFEMIEKLAKALKVRSADVLPF
ncbi:MAG TPA: helix-turn-helix transcriptional regulator [Candidatus Saccharimonadales bacterium]|nr:helix-turn-helix transcriptional regulator [Candidatus Saccharimonadales bacterium]